MSAENSAATAFPIELFDDDGLAATVAKITGGKAGSADEFTFYILLIMDELGSGASEQVRRALWRSVELAFPFTEAFRAALDLYILDKRGRLTGHSTSTELIRELVGFRS